MKRKKILVSILIALMLGIVQPISTTVRGHNQSDTLTVENTPVEQGSESDNGENEDNNEFPTVYDNAYDTVDIANDGGITLISNHANENQVSTLALVLNLKVRDDVEEEISINNASFEFDNALYGKIKVLEYHSDYYQDSVKLTLYVSNTETVFDENGCLYLGRVIVDGISLEAIDIEKEPLEYVYHNEVACFNIAETTTTTEETTTTTEETTTTTEETTTTTEETTTTTEET
ncbi:MAG: hypothetical protein K2G88_09025, partial [Oscillospiraceae bacterium]|nr:hypothetical protein [Oscillospiraceae bacterium]